MDSSKGKNRESTKGLDHSQDATSKDKEKGDEDYTYAPTSPSHLDRTMFIVDLSRLKAEGDTLENALVMYRPEKELKKPQYEQRCSQLVGLSLCTMNFTGKFPEFLRLKGTGYAIRGLGEHYVMGLSSRVEEPPAYCVNYLKSIHDLFRFYYNSPSVVLEANEGDWAVFSKRVTEYMGGILEYILRDQHSVPAMLNPLPYMNTDHCKKDASRLYLLASRILRACQHHSSIVGGCVLNYGDLVMSQFPPEITEKLLVIGGGGVSLTRNSVLADNIAPGKVWVLEVFLTPDEENMATDYRKDHSGLNAAYSTLDSNSHLTTSTLSSSAGTLRTRGQWRRATRTKSPVSRSESMHSGLSSPPSQSTTHTSGKTTTTSQTPPSSQKSTPLNSSTPVPKTTKKHKSETLRSEDAVVFSPGLSSVAFEANLAKESPVDEEQRTSSSSSTKLDGDESEYVDAVETIDPTMALTRHTADLVNPPPSRPATLPQPTGKKEQESDAVFVDSRPDSISSEGFATPSPTPPRERSSVFSNKSLYTTASEDSGESETTKKSEDNGTLTRDQSNESQTVTTNPADLTHEELTKLINTPVFVDRESKQTEAKITDIKGTTHVMALPTPMRTWKFKTTPESDDEDDFVDSDALQQMLSATKQEIEHERLTSPPRSTKSENSKWSPPPPLPPRNSTMSRSRSQPPLSQRNPSGESPIAPPPLPPRNYGQTTPTLQKENDFTDGGSNGQPGLDVPTVQSRASIYKTMDRGKTGIGMKSSDVFNQGSDEEGLTRSKKSTNEIKQTSKAINGDVDLSVVDVYDVIPNSLEVDEIDQSDGGNETNGQLDEIPSPASDEELCESRTLDIYSDQPILSIVARTAPSTTDSAPVPNGQAGPSETIADTVPTPNGEVRPSEREVVEPTESLQTEESAQVVKESKSVATTTASPAAVNETEDVSLDEVSFILDTASAGKKDDVLDDSASNDIIFYEHVEARSDPFKLAPPRRTVSASISSDTFKSDLESSFDDTVTGGAMTPPVDMSYNPDSMMNVLPLKLGLTTPPAPPPRGPVRLKKSRGSEDSTSRGDELSDDGESSDSDVAMATGGGKEWLTKTIPRPPSTGNVGPHVTKMCLYVQQYMGTEILLLADNGLHKDHTVLNSLWRSLLHQLMELEMGLRKDGQDTNDRSHRPQNYIVTYSNYDRRCEAVPHTAAYHFRHALRRIHQEYVKDASLLQVSFSKEHLRVLSQCVHEREIYLQPGRLGHLDALAMHGAVEKYAKVKSSLRQQPIGGPKVMFV